MFRTTIGIQSEPDAVDKSRFALTFLATLGVTEILRSFKLVLKEKTGKEIPESSKLEFLEKFSANHFPLSDAKVNTSRPFKRVDLADLPLLKTLLRICQNPESQVSGK